MISSLSVINIWVSPALSLRGRPRGAGPLPGTLKVRLAIEGGLTFITPPRFILLFPTVPAAKLCICDCMVKGFLWSFHASSDCHHSFFHCKILWIFSMLSYKLSALYALKASENFFATSSALYISYSSPPLSSKWSFCWTKGSSTLYWLYSSITRVALQPKYLLPLAGVHFSFDVLPSWADQGSCAHKCVC